MYTGKGRDAAGLRLGSFEPVCRRQHAINHQESAGGKELINRDSTSKI